MACKEYSAVFLSLRINKDKTPVRVKSLTQLNVCPMLNLKGRGVMGGSSSNFFFSLFSAEISVIDVLCPWAVDVPKVWMATPIHQLTCLFLAVLGCKYQKVLSISQEVWGVEGQHPHTQSWESIAATALVMVRHFQSKIGRAVPVPQGPSSTSTLQVQILGGWGAARSPMLGQGLLVLRI